MTGSDRTPNSSSLEHLNIKMSTAQPLDPRQGPQRRTSHDPAQHQRDVSQDGTVSSVPQSMELPGRILSDFGAPLPTLHTPHRKRLRKLCIGLFLITMDLCVLPIVYYYAFKFGTNLTLQQNFAIITGVYGMLSFTHYFFRSLKLFRKKTAPKFRPVAWTKWGTAEFTEVNTLVLIILIEIELISATIPHDPIVRLCAMPSPTICFYMSFLFLVSGILTSTRKRLPFNMSSTPKGEYWRPALIAFIEDVGAVEGGAGVVFRDQVMNRWEVSPEFRSLIELLNWMWGLGLLGIATITTTLVMTLEEDVGFGIGWGLPYVFGSSWVWLTIVICRRHLKKEKIAWSLKEESNSMDMEFA